MSQRAPAKRPGGPRPKPNLELLRLRIEEGLSRDDLGRLAGISGKQVGLLERGLARRPREATMHGIAEALRTTPTRLFEIKDRVR